MLSKPLFNRCDMLAAALFGSKRVSLIDSGGDVTVSVTFGEQTHSVSADRTSFFRKPFEFVETLLNELHKDVRAARLQKHEPSSPRSQNPERYAREASALDEHKKRLLRYATAQDSFAALDTGRADGSAQRVDALAMERLQQVYERQTPATSPVIPPVPSKVGPTQRKQERREAAAAKRVENTTEEDLARREVKDRQERLKVRFQGSNRDAREYGVRTWSRAFELSEEARNAWISAATNQLEEVGKQIDADLFGEGTGGAGADVIWAEAEEAAQALLVFAQERLDEARSRRAGKGSALAEVKEAPGVKHAVINEGFDEASAPANVC